MLTSTLEGVEFASEYPELAGKRVLLTGVSGNLGVEIARALGESRTRLVLQAADDGPETLAVAEIVAQSALDVRLFTGPFSGSDAKLRFARDAVQCFGGLDCVINLAIVGDIERASSEGEIEAAVTDLLAMPVLVSKVAANRMRTLCTEGTILNVIAERREAAPIAQTIGAVARSTLASLTRAEARNWAPDGIRINAIAPARAGVDGHGCISSAPDLATLVLHLASERGHRLSGLVFEAYCG